jgi:iron complex outermembrane receptor protein
MSDLKTKLMLRSTVTILACWTAPALAQTAPIPSSATSETGAAANDQGISDIVVTASKRSERALEVPGAITAFRGEDLLASGATSIRDFAALTPGLQFNNSVGSGAPIIRGLSIGIDTSPTVATVVNGAPIGSSSSLNFGAQETLDLDPIDFDRVEVLKGPQGTVYGANTLGGLISYTLHQPSLSKTEVIARGEVSTTRHGDLSYSTRAAIGAPLVTDVLAARLSGFYDKRGGFIDNAARGIKNENSAASYGGHGALLFQPTDQLHISLDGLFQHLTADAGDVVVYNFADKQPRNGGLRYDEYVLPSTVKNTTVGILNVDYDFGFANLTSVTSRQYIHSIDVQNASSGSLANTLAVLPRFGGPALPTPRAVQLGRDNTVHKTTQELRLTSPGDQRFSWILGGYYNHETTRYLASYSGQTTTGALLPTLAPALLFTVNAKLEEYSAFVNGTFKITPQLDVTGGFRIGQIKQNFTQTFSGSDSVPLNTVLKLTGANPIPFATAPASSKDKPKTYLATLRYHFSPDGIVFGRFSTGYRPGGPNLPTPALAPTFNSDKTQNYEAGFKTKLFGGRGSLDITGYYERWKDILVVVTSGGLSGYANGGTARIYGLEAAFSLRPVPPLTLNATFAYSKGKILNASPVTKGTLAAGDPLPYNPAISASFSAEYRAPVSQNWEGYASGAVHYSDDRYSVFRSRTVSPTYKLPEYALVDFRLGMQNEKLMFEVFARNVFDSRAQLAANPFYNLAEVTVARPRTFGISGTIKY